MKRWIRRTAWLLLTTAALLAACEWWLWWSGEVLTPKYNQHVQWYRLDDTPAESVTLVEPQPFVTNADGLWVANPALPGINSAGFRSPEFTVPGAGRKSVLILGDQMAYGELARPISQCFADRLRREGYRVHNLGVPDTGPDQYAARAARYVPELHPDAVVVVFYTGNDYTRSPRLQPSEPLMYYTTAGPFEAVDATGAPVTLEASYRSRQALFGGGAGAMVMQALLSTRVGTWVFDVFDGDDPSYTADDAEAIRHLREIQDLCRTNNAAFILLVAPVTPLYETPVNNAARARAVLAEFAPAIPPGLSAAHYAMPPEAYLNNEGHDLYFHFLLDLLRQRGIAPLPAQ